MSAFPSDYRSWLTKLVSFDTTSRNSNLPLIHYVRDFFIREIKVPESHIILVYNEKKDKANMMVTVMPLGAPAGSDGSGSGDINGGIVLSGHSDVVPVDGQKWSSDPFVVTERDGRLYGRGTCDMKGFLAIALALAPRLVDPDDADFGKARRRPVHFCFSYDEEIGCQGIPALIDRLRTRPPHGSAGAFSADACLIGEPTEMQVFTGNKGFKEWTVRVKGKAAHSSLALMNTSCNAIEHAASIIAFIRALSIQVRENTDNAFHYNEKDSHYQCPFSPISTGLLSGGNAVNTVPAYCEFVFSVRLTTAALAEEIERRVRGFIDATVLPAMRAEAGDEAGVEMTPGVAYPPFSAKEEDAVVRDARALRCDREVHKLGGGTEAGFFQEVLGIPTIIVGPGELTVAHQPDEYVSLAQMEESVTFTRKLVHMYTCV